jgi:hypothetical protein
MIEEEIADAEYRKDFPASYANAIRNFEIDDELAERIRSWWIEVDEDGQVIRAIGFEENGE